MRSKRSETLRSQLTSRLIDTFSIAKSVSMDSATLNDRLNNLISAHTAMTTFRPGFTGNIVKNSFSEGEKRKTMYNAKTTVVVKGYHPKAQRQRTKTDVTIASAETLPELKKKLADFFGPSWKHKRPMYRDTSKGTKQCGWVVGRRMDEGPGAKWLQEDWVSVTQCEAVEW